MGQYKIYTLTVTLFFICLVHTIADIWFKKIILFLHFLKDQKQVGTIFHLKREHQQYAKNTIEERACSPAERRF